MLGIGSPLLAIAGWPALINGGNEPVTPPWNRNNVTVLASFFAEYAP